MSLGYTQDGKGDLSSIRLSLIICLILGSIIIISGIIGWFLLLKDAVLMVGAGAGLITGTGIAKAWQSTAEYGEKQ